MNNPEQATDTTEPTRIRNFRHALDGLEWSDNKRLGNLKTIFKALHELAANDLKYYDDHREKSKNSSRWAIGLSILFSTLGAITITLQGVKLIYDTLGISSSEMAAIGSAFIVIAAASLAWDKYLGASGSHIRYVVAQFDLGKAINKFELDWQKWLNKYSHTTPPNEEAAQAAFVLFNNFAALIYKIILDDTEKWGKSLTDAINELEKRVNEIHPKS
jgi:hypothetical protein